MRIALVGVFLAAAWGATALAAPLDACTATQRACLAQCDLSYPGRDDMAHAGCLARCSWDGAACAAQRTLDDTQAALDREVKPWLEDQAGKWQRFLDGFRRAPEPPPSSRPNGAPDRGTPL